MTHYFLSRKFWLWNDSVFVGLKRDRRNKTHRVWKMENDQASKAAVSKFSLLSDWPIWSALYARSDQSKPKISSDKKHKTMMGASLELVSFRYSFEVSIIQCRLCTLLFLGRLMDIYPCTDWYTGFHIHRPHTNYTCQISSYVFGHLENAKRPPGWTPLGHLNNQASKCVGCLSPPFWRHKRIH